MFSKNGCAILRCDECGLGRAETAGFDPSAYYTEDYFSGGHADGYADYRGAEPVLRREFRRTVDFVRRFRPSGRLLEIGCAYGFFLKEARTYFQVCGTELAEEAAAACREAGLDVVSEGIEQEALDRFGPQSVIVLLDVIEHLPDPGSTLARCASMLEPGGVLILTTGDFSSLLARLAGPGWRLMTPPQHLWFFTPESLSRLSGSLALELEHVDHPWKTVPVSLILFQLRRMLGRPPRRGAVASRLGLPVNLFDAMRVVLRKPASR